MASSAGQGIITQDNRYRPVAQLEDALGPEPSLCGCNSHRVYHCGTEASASLGLISLVGRATRRPATKFLAPFVQRQDPKLTSSRWEFDPLTGHHSHRKLPHNHAAVAQLGRRLRMRRGVLEVRILSAALRLAMSPRSARRHPLAQCKQSGDMGRQRPASFGKRSRPRASRGSPIKIRCARPRGVADARRGPNAQGPVQLRAGASRFAPVV